jgi:hypothetical protein
MSLDGTHNFPGVGGAPTLPTLQVPLSARNQLSPLGHPRRALGPMDLGPLVATILERARLCHGVIPRISNPQEYVNHMFKETLSVDEFPNLEANSKFSKF